MAEDTKAASGFPRIAPMIGTQENLYDMVRRRILTNNFLQISPYETYRMREEKWTTMYDIGSET